MEDSAHYVLGVGPRLLELYKAAIKLENIPRQQNGAHIRLHFSYDDFKKEVKEEETIPTVTEFFQTVCALVTEVAVLRDLAAEAILTFPPEQGAIPLSLLHAVVRALFPTVEQTLQALVLDQVAITPSEPLAQATDNSSAVNIKRLEIRNSPALFAQPGLVKQLIRGFGKIEELVLVGGHRVNVDANEFSQSASPPQITERIILEFPEEEFPKDILGCFGYSPGLEGFVEGDTRLTSILVEKSREESPSSTTPILGDVITYEDSVSDFDVATKSL